MTNATKLVTLFAALAAAAACTKKSEKYCAQHPEDVAECGGSDVDGGVDGDGAPIGCTSNAGCADPTPVCDLGESTCVQCLPDQAGACTGTTPICVETACERCTAHAQCASNACMPDGSCADPDTVAYVSPTGMAANDCSKDAPCTTVTKALTTARPIVKVQGDILEASGISIVNRNVTVLAETSPQARLSRSMINGPVIQINGTSEVAIYDLEVRDAPTPATGRGILVDDAFTGKLTLDRVKVYGNAGGGLELRGTGAFSITSSVFAFNGTASGLNKSITGGVRIENNAPNSRFDFNTVVYNGSSGSSAVGGLQCSADQVSATGNLIHGNAVTEGTGVRSDATTQRAGSCMFGTSNATFLDADDPKFAKLDAPPDFHLTAASPASLIDAGGACTGTDLDGAARPLGGGCDLGADEAR